VKVENKLKREYAVKEKNGGKVSGPVTEEGKAKVSQNAVKFGLYANDIVIDSKYRKESAEEYGALLESLYEEFDPGSVFQEFLLVKIANSLWRCRRAAAAETAQINHQLAGIDHDLELRATLLSLRDKEPSIKEIREFREQMKKYLVGMKSIPEEAKMKNILRYEMRLDRQLSRAFRLMRQLKRRKGRGASGRKAT
jgi:hypothetical protein